MTESQFQSKLIKYYEGAGWTVLKLIQVNRAGYPDLLLMKPDRPPLFVEVKATKGKLSPVQEYRHAELRAKGFEVQTVYAP